MKEYPLIVDIDDTLLKTKWGDCKDCGCRHYGKPEPIQEEIDMVNKYYDKGRTIILWTGRNWDKYEMTLQNLKDIGVKYHQLIMGKPQGEYIDRTHNYKSLKEYESAFNSDA